MGIANAVQIFKERHPNCFLQGLEDMIICNVYYTILCLSKERNLSFHIRKKICTATVMNQHGCYSSVVIIVADIACRLLYYFCLLNPGSSMLF